jgi:lysM domain protein
MREFWKNIIIGGAFVGLAALCSGAVNPWDDTRDAVLVEETYTVRQGDTLWGIAEEYVAKNTGTRRYILEYKSGIEELNPWLLERKGMIYPGDKLTLTYWVKENKEEQK